MTDIDSILDNATQWTTESVTKPTIKTGQLFSAHQMNRGIVVRKVTRDDQLVGIVDRSHYSVDSHEAWICDIVSTTSADLENMIGCVYRIIAEYPYTDGEETYLTWEGGTYRIVNNFRFSYSFVILRKKSIQSEF